MSDCIIKGNKADSIAGAILANENSSVYLTNTYFDDNKADDAGGAIYGANNSSLWMENCSFNNNQVTTLSRQGYGGAIYLVNNSWAQIDNVKFTQNMATFGSAIYGTASCTLSCKSCSFHQNIIPRSDTATIQMNNHSELYITNLKCERQMGTFMSCISATHHCSVFIYDSIFCMNTGSVISVLYNSSLVTVNSSFFNNLSPGNVGCINSFNSTLDISHSIFGHNEALTGGALFLELSRAMLNNCTFHYNSDIAVALRNTNISVENCAFRNNSSPEVSGAILLREHCSLNASNTIFLQNSGGKGGAVWAHNSSLLMSNCSFSGNSVLNPMFSLYSDKGLGGAIFINESQLETHESHFFKNSACFLGGSVYSTNESSLFVSDSTFESNTAGSFGGAIAIENNSSVTIDNSSFINNNVQDNVFGKIGNYSTYRGGGAIVISEWSVLKVYQSRFSKNYASFQGGALLSLRSYSFIHSSRFLNNIAGVLGGAITGVNNSCVITEHSSFINNSVANEEYGKIKNMYDDTEEAGGAIFLYRSELKTNQTQFTHNFAVCGGSVTSLESSLSVHGTTFKDNFAGSYGGAIYSDDRSSLVIEDSTLKNNTVLGGISKGGGLFLTMNWIVNVSNVHFIENRARDGAAIYSSNHCQITISNNSSFVGNTQVAISITNRVTLYINGCQFHNNLGALMGSSYCVTRQTKEDLSMCQQQVMFIFIIVILTITLQSKVVS